MQEQSQQNSSERKLVAIMFTDIVGYTSLMQRDEKKALNTIERHRSAVDKFTKQYHGNILHYYGDGSLSIFPSTIEAVKCALEIQKELTQDFKVPLRIGVHLGDIQIKGESVFGDGVNLASRIESLGIAGSILISDTIYHIIRNHTDIKTVSLGNFKLKNVDYPVPVYALSDDFLSIPESEELPGRITAFSKRSTWVIVILSIIILALSGYAISRLLYPMSSLNEHLEKSIAVLPFENLSDDPEQEYFSDGITEDVINHLVKISNLKVKSRTTTEQYKDPDKTLPVIGRELGVAYILEGSVRKAGNKVRIVAQLLDVGNDVHVWSETFDREITEILDIQSDIAIEIAQVLEASLSSDERRHIRGGRRDKGRTANITAYDYLLKARESWRNWNDENDLDNVMQLVDQAIKLDPNFARAYVLKGNILHYGMREFGVPTTVWIDQALDLANRAIRIDSMLAGAYLLKGNILSSQDLDSEEALENLKKAYYLEPGNPEVLQSLAYINMRFGNYEKAASKIIQSIEREYSLKDPEYYYRWGDIYWMINDSEKAEIFYLKAINLNPGWLAPYYSLGQLYRYVGDINKAEKTLSRALEIAPNDQQAIDLMGWINLAAGDLEDAARYWSKYEQIEKEFTDSSQYLPFRHRLGYVKLLQGDSVKGRNLINEQLTHDLERHQNLRGYGVWMNRGYFYDLAASYAYLGDSDKALAWLDSAFQRGFMNSWYLKNDPLLENIRDDARFKRIQQEYEDRRQKQADAFYKAIEENQALQQELERLPLNTSEDL
jgi:TolB-like protein/class 3 adenylate cyclase/Flp pilus assembly protein TadD